MRVAIIGHKQIPGRSGGVEVVVQELAGRLVRRGVEVIAYNRKVRGHSSPSTFEGVHLVDIPTPNNKTLNAVVYSYLATVSAIASGVDLIHYHALGPAASLWLAKIFRKKVVVTVHGLNYKTPKWKGFGAKYIKFGEKIAMRFADEVIVLSQSIKRYYFDEYGRECLYLPNGLSMPEVPSDDSCLDRLGLRNRNFLLCVSRLVPGKGLEALVQAFKKVKTDANLIIAGDSDHVDSFKESLKDLSIDDDRIRFIGFTAKDELCVLYSAARLFVFPSEAEGMPMALLEAMWFDCPCVVSDIPENIEVLGDSGTTFAVGDIDDLRKKLQDACDVWPPRESTRRVVKSSHDWEIVADKTLDIYNEVLA